MAKLNMKRIQDALVNRGLAGAAGGAVTQLIVDKLPSSINPAIKNIGAIVVGAIVPEMSPKTKFLEGVGAGMAAIGGAGLYKSVTGGTTTKSGDVNGLEDEGWTPTVQGLPMDDDDDMNGIGADEFTVDNDGEDVNGTGTDNDNVTLE